MTDKPWSKWQIVSPGLFQRLRRTDTEGVTDVDEFRIIGTPAHEAMVLEALNATPTDNAQ